MRYRSTIAAAALLLTQTAYAYQTDNFNFTQQSAQYYATFAEQSDIINPSAPQHSEPPAVTAAPKYLSTAPEKDWDYLLEQTYTILGISVATVGLMTFLPESVTNWTAEDRSFSNLTHKWWDNVSEGPVWDHDDHYLNYILHPYFGGVYYTSARHAGFTIFESFLYSFTMSTFFWEYGVESFAEVPSTQDIIITPFFGALVGEWMYQGERNILANDGMVLGSEFIGDVSLFFLNPIGHIHHWITGIWRDEAKVSLSYDPWLNNKNAAQFAKEAGVENTGSFVGMQVNFKF